MAVEHLPIAVKTLFGVGDYQEKVVLSPRSYRKGGLSRFYLRAPAAMSIRPSLPSLQREDAVARVVMKDISRAAVALLHNEQLFPGERLRLTWPNGEQRDTVVVRCRRIQADCYEVAARFIASDESPYPS